MNVRLLHARTSSIISFLSTYHSKQKKKTDSILRSLARGPLPVASACGPLDPGAMNYYAALAVCAVLCSGDTGSGNRLVPITGEV